MNIENFAISVALILITTASLAGDPPASGATVAPKPLATSANSPRPAAPTQAAAADAAATAKQAHALGYTQKSRNGKPYYCKAEAAIGTRLESMKCFSEQEMTAVVQRSIANQDSVSHMQRVELYEENKH